MNCNVQPPEQVLSGDEKNPEINIILVKFLLIQFFKVKTHFYVLTLFN